MSDLKWGWVNPSGEVQTEVFGSAEAAVAGMQSRLGEDYTIERIAQAGFSLALVRVRVEAVLVMNPCWTRRA